MTDHANRRFRAVTLFAIALAASAAQRPNFTSTWKWNAALSDDPMEKLTAARNGGRFGDDDVLDFLRAAESVTIDRTGGELSIRDSEGRTLGGNTVRWEGGLLIHRGAMLRGVRHETIFNLTDGGRKLVITRHLQFPRARNPIVVRYVYDRLAAESADVPFGPAQRA